MSTCLWTFGRYLGRVLMTPTLSVAAVYLVSGIIGGLASANLAVDRVTVTSTAAVCGYMANSTAAWGKDRDLTSDVGLPGLQS